MTLYEIEGFLRGKCLPGDMLVNESAAEYIFRKLKGRDAVVAENAALNKFIKDDCWLWDDKSEEYLDAADCSPETPATDAALADIEARGVEKGIAHLLQKFEGTGQIGVPIMALEWLAAELRKGVGK